MLIPFGVFSAAGAGGGASAGSFDLISSTILTGSQASVTFDVTGLGSTYKHLQLRLAARTNNASQTDDVRIRLNGDTGSNYPFHQLYGNGSSVVSNGAASLSGLYVTQASGASATANIFSGSIVDFLDFASTTKNKTVRGLTGVNVSTQYIYLKSGAWLNTAAVTSLLIAPQDGTAFVSGSRFSIYGVK